MYQLQNIDYLYRISTMTGSSKLVTVQADRDSHDLNDKHFVTLNLSLVSGFDGIKNGRQHPGPEQQEGQECFVSGRRAS